MPRQVDGLANEMSEFYNGKKTTLPRGD